MWSYIKSEPAALMGLLGTIIALVTAFGLELTGKQVGAIMAVAAALLSIVTRQMVTPVSKLLKKKQP